jgi:hypothetical protein
LLYLSIFSPYILPSLKKTPKNFKSWQLFSFKENTLQWQWTLVIRWRGTFYILWTDLSPVRTYYVKLFSKHKNCRAKYLSKLFISFVT